MYDTNFLAPGGTIEAIAKFEFVKFRFIGCLFWSKFALENP